MSKGKSVGIKSSSPASGNATLDSQSSLVDKIVFLSSNLLVIEDIEDFVKKLADIAVSHFPIKAMIIYLLDDYGNFIPELIYGFPEDRINSVRSGSVYTQKEVEEMESIRARPVGKLSMFYPAELVDLNDDRDIISSLDIDKIHEPRLEKDDFHPLDALVIRFLNRSGKEIGSFFIVASTTGKQFDNDMISGLEVLASFASVSIELMQLRDREQNMLESLEKRAKQISQIFSVTSSIAAISDPQKLATRVIEIIQELFGFRSCGIEIYDEIEGCYRWVAVRGYSDAERSRALSLRIPKEIAEYDLKPEFKVGYLVHFKPGEKTIVENLSYHFEIETLEKAKQAMKIPRKSPDSWHPLDDLSFSINDRNGRIIGIISPDNPIDNKIPSRETLELIEVFVSIIAIAFENAAIYQDASIARDEVRVLNRLMFHDMMNYCMAIRGYLDLSLGQTSDAMIERYVERAMKQIEQTSELIAKVRKLSLIKSADKRNLMRIDLATTVMNQATKTAGLFPVKKVKFDYNFDSKNAYVMANDLLPDLFHNIFMNAIKFDSHENVLIDVGLKKVMDDPSNPKSAYWQVSIADHGPGIPDERKQAIFLGSQRMTQTEPGRGMGLGLSIVKSLVGLYSGRVWAEDRKPGDCSKGTVFFVKLPAA